MKEDVSTAQQNCPWFIVTLYHYILSYKLFCQCLLHHKVPMCHCILCYWILQKKSRTGGNSLNRIYESIYSHPLCGCVSTSERNWSHIYLTYTIILFTEHNSSNISFCLHFQYVQSPFEVLHKYAKMNVPGRSEKPICFLFPSKLFWQ